ncbi:NAD-dependent epimerase/dehydratase family protein [Amycolatopsis acidiphila]|uniref:NAD-dependent epimerase/dehydratase family protein n=1 Tax=Amycolatopsis acidiphila TaxID=715473 RepID=A0A558A702_9PSEU|nr:NAD-dependent epimerase/dehydratase family protein [Amycolatopsis acidiphila]TVT20040.1 NAD-dependent epimerase/dehydratase family protein [Amycolatopsis acidiphila]UIJ63504.1 NAD-dependent epimerase/dehydratase family protein [Amycolatopsis acidiphila]
MRIVVTGATGNVGTALVRILREQDCSVTGLARRIPPAEGPYAAVDWVPGDLARPASLEPVLRGADALVHLAWAVNPSAGDPPMAATNLTGTRRLLDAAAAAGVPRIVCASSVAAYSPAPRWERVREDWPCDGISASAYSRGKAELERLLDVFAREHPDVLLTRVRPCAILQRDAGGEFGRWLLSPLLPAGIVAVPGFPLPLWPELRLQVVHAQDVAEAVWLALSAGFSGPVNLASDPVLRADDVAGLLGALRLPVPRPLLSGAAWSLWRAGVQPLHPGWLALADEAALADTTLARTELGWRPRRDAAAVLAEFADGLRDQAATSAKALAPRPATLRERLATLSWGRPSHQSQA